MGRGIEFRFIYQIQIDANYRVSIRMDQSIPQKLTNGLHNYIVLMNRYLEKS